MSVFLSIKVYQILSTLIYKSIIQIFKGINTSTLSSYHLYTRSCILSRDVHYITHSSIDILETNNTIFEIFLSSNQIPSLDPIIDLKLMKYLFSIIFLYVLPSTITNLFNCRLLYMTFV